jgi:CspA family cold shock protein
MADCRERAATSVVGETEVTGKRQVGLATGRVLQFDHTRGYGFVAAEDGGDDVFLHASVFNGYPDMLVPGALVEFQIMAGDRGRKAYEARLADEEWEKEPVRSADQVPAPALQIPAPAPAAEALPADDDQMCDVLSSAEFGAELTELLLNTVPELTGQQIIQVRRSILEFAKQHGWSEG